MPMIPKRGRIRCNHRQLLTGNKKQFYATDLYFCNLFPAGAVELPLQDSLSTLKEAERFYRETQQKTFSLIDVSAECGGRRFICAGIKMWF